MPDGALWLFSLLMLIPAGEKTDNPWAERVEPAVRRAAGEQTVDAYRAAFDAAWRGDDWQASLKLAREAEEKHPNSEALRGAIIRAYWRAGEIETAEKRFEGVQLDESTDRVALAMAIIIHSSRGEHESAARAGVRLEKFADLSAAELFYVVGARLTRNDLDGMVALLKRAERLADAKNGYPEIYIADEVKGVAEFVEAVGPRPLNQIAAYGEAPMRAAPLINLPICDVTINGKGPYRLIVDTGGSIMVALDKEVAEEVGLKIIADALVRGVGGIDESGQALIDDLRIGNVRCERVMTRVLDLKKAVMGAADGILGTGIFSDGRMTMDFETGRLIVENSAEHPATGTELKLRLIGDAKLVSPVNVNGHDALMIFDSGADAGAFSPSRLRQLFPDREPQTLQMPAMGGVGSSSAPEVSFGPGVDLRIGERGYSKFSGLGLDVLDTILSPILMMQCDVLVGMPVMRDMRTLTVDYPKCRMWADWLPPD